MITPDRLNVPSSYSHEATVDQMMSDVPMTRWDTQIDPKASYDASGANVNSIYNTTFYVQFNEEHNFLSALPVRTRETTNLEGPVTANAFRAAHSPVSLQASNEGGNVPAGETFSTEQVSYDPKTSETVVEVSDVLQIRSTIEDANSAEDFLEEQRDQLDLAIDREGIADGVTSNDDLYGSTRTPTSLDRVIASGDEVANAQGVDSAVYSTGDELDYGSIERGTDNWADGFVDHNGGTPRQLTETLMTNFLNDFNEQADVNVFEDTAILTGHRTGKILSDLAAARNQTRINVEMPADNGVEAVQDAETMRGLPGTGRYRSFDGVPIVQNQHVPEHGNIGSIFVVPTDTINGVPRLGVEQFVLPGADGPVYNERAGAGRGQGYLATGDYTEDALFKIHHEVVCRDFSSTAKLRDLEE